MGLHIGRKYNVGIGKETVRGTAVAPTYWLPKMDFDIDDKINYVTDDSSVGVIEGSQGQDVTTKYAEGSITGRLNDTALGLVLLGVFGTDTPTVVGGETLVYDHAFTVLETAQHPTLTIGVAGPNESTGYRHALAMIDQLDIDFEVNKYCQYKAGFRANVATAGANTASFSTSENAFLPQHATLKFASNLAGLSGASAVSVRKASITIKTNVEEDYTIGNQSPVDRVNKTFEVEGTVELVYSDRTYIDALTGDTAKAVRLTALMSGTTIGNSSNPTLTIDLAKVKFTEVARNISNDDVVTQTLKFKAHYSLADSKMITATLRNLVASAY